MSDAYEVITWRGHRFDRMTVQAIEAAEKLAGYKFVVTQGSYNGGKVAQSGGTHDGGGAVDFDNAPLPSHQVRCLRRVGFAAWVRTPDQGDWGTHVHAVLIGNAKLSPSAARQVEAYKNHRDGLRSNAPDPTWHPDPIKPYVYQEDDMAAEDVWDYPLRNGSPDGTGKPLPAGKLLSDLEKNVDAQAIKLAEISAKLDRLLAKE